MQKIIEHGFEVLFNKINKEVEEKYVFFGQSLLLVF